MRKPCWANPRLATIAFWTRIGYGARPDPLPQPKYDPRKRDNYAWICDNCAPADVELKTLGSDGPCVVCGKRAPCMLCPKDKLPEPLSAAQRWAQAELDCLLFGKAEVLL